MPKGCQGTRTELHEADNLEKMLRKEYELLRYQKRPCLRTLNILELAACRAGCIVGQIAREYYGNNHSHFPDDNGNWPFSDK